MAIPVQVIGLDADQPFAESCVTIVISKHGCGFRFPRVLDAGISLRLEILQGKRAATAVVRNCTRTRDGKAWEVGVELNDPSDFWGIQFPSGGEEVVPSRRSEAPAEDGSVAAESEPAASFEEAVADEPEPLPAPPSTGKSPATGADVSVFRPPVEEPAPPAGEFKMPVVVVPPLPPSRTPPSPARPGDVESDAELRRKAAVLSAEFEETYRRNLGDLMLRLRADLEQRATEDWERLGKEFQKQFLQGALAHELRQKLFQDLEAHEREVLDHVAVRLEELRATQQSVRREARSAASSLGQHSQELNLAAKAAIKNLGRELWSSLEQQLRGEFSRQKQELALALETTRVQAERLEERTRALADVVEVQFGAQVDELVAEAVSRARQQLQLASESARELHVEQRQADVERLLEPLVHRAEAATRELEQRLDVLRVEGARLHSQTSALQQQLDAARASLSQEAAVIHRAAQDALLETSGQIRGQVRAAAELAGAPIEQRGRELKEDLESLVIVHGHKLEQRFTEAFERIRSEQAHAQQALDASLQARQEELLAGFQQEAEARSRRALSQWQDAIQQSLLSFQRSLEEKLKPGS